MDINYLAVVVCGVVAMILGGLWYGPLFGKMWMQGMGWDPNNAELMAQKKKSAGPAYAQMFVLSLVQAYVLANVLVWVFYEVDSTVVAGIVTGAFVWLGFILPVKYGDKLWGDKAFKYVAIDLSYYLILLIVMGIILSVWK